MSTVDIFIIAGQVLIAACMLSAIVLMLRVKDSGSRAVLSDMVFFGMLGFYVLWTMNHDTQIAYDIMFLGTLGCLSTVSMARILSNGRR